MIGWLAVALGAEDGMPLGPASVGLLDGELGRARSVNPRTELDLAPRALLLVDTPGFYGQIVVGAAIEAAIAPDPATEIRLRLEPVRYQNVISAIPADAVGVGFTTVGLTRRLSDGPVAFVADLVLPSAIGLYGHSWPFALDLAVAAERARGAGALHGQLGAVMSAAASRGPTQPRAGLVGTVGAVWRPGKAFAAVLDLQTSFGYTAVLDHLAVAPALRFASGAWGLELAVAAPLAGRERALAAAELHSSVRF